MEVFLLDSMPVLAEVGLPALAMVELEPILLALEMGFLSMVFMEQDSSLLGQTVISQLCTLILLLGPCSSSQELWVCLKGTMPSILLVLELSSTVMMPMVMLSLDLMLMAMQFVVMPSTHTGFLVTRYIQL